MDSEERSAGLRGLLTYRPESIKLKFADVFNRAVLPQRPKSFGHISNTPPKAEGAQTASWGMLGNNKVGNCVLCGAAHEIMAVAAASKRPVPLFTEAGIIKQYLQLTGGLDIGLDAAETAEFRRKTGVLDARGRAHKVHAYVAVDSPDDVLMAAYLYCASGAGLFLPQSAEDQYRKGHIWDDLQSTPSFGHYMPVLSVNSVGNVVFSTWGGLQAATPEYFKRYFMIGIAYFDENYVLPSGVSPEGFRHETLEEYLASL